MEDRLNSIQLEAIALLSSGLTQVVVARQLGIEKKELQSWITRDFHFKRELEISIDEYRDDYGRLLATLPIICLKKVKELLESENEMVVHKALVTGLDACGLLTKKLEITDRTTELWNREEIERECNRVKDALRIALEKEIRQEMG